MNKHNLYKSLVTKTLVTRDERKRGKLFWSKLQSTMNPNSFWFIANAAAKPANIREGGQERQRERERKRYRARKKYRAILDTSCSVLGQIRVRTEQIS